MEMKAKSFLGLLLILALTLGLIPGMTMTAAADDYGLWVNGVQVTSANKDNVLQGDPVNQGKVSFVPGSSGDTNPYHKLTLKGVNLTSRNDSYPYAAIHYTGGRELRIILTPGTRNMIDVTRESDSVGIYSTNKLAIEGNGSGSLEIKASASGIRLTSTVFINGSSISVTAQNYGIEANSVAVTNGGRVDSSGNGNDGIGICVYGNNYITINNGTSVTAAGEGFALGRKNSTEAKAVKNEIPGIGWTDTAGKEGKADISVVSTSSEGQSLSQYKRVQFPPEPDPTPTAAPTAASTAAPTAAPTEAPTPATAAPTATPQPVPKTGDSANPVLWLSLMLLGLAGIGGLTASKIRK